jgi:H+-translocating NAD(P) transhydrogenase subunit alpha
MSSDTSALTAGVLTESFPGEHRVAIVPSSVKPLAKAGFSLVIQAGAGLAAGFRDSAYSEAGATLVDSRDEVFQRADVLAVVRAGGANPEHGDEDLRAMRSGQTVVGHLDPLSEPESIRRLAERQVRAFSLELLPRITRAQSMDVLSSMATVAGYKAVLLAADNLPRMFPLMMTAAGTIKPARVFVMGAGVAGLQAIATAKRLGAVVYAYDVRPVVKEQVESVGGKFVVLDLDTGEAETKGGYAKEMGEEFLKRQREELTKVIADCDVVITTAAIPGRQAPILVTRQMVEAMAAGSVIIDLAAERGGNCELTRAGEIVEVNEVSIHGPVNLSASIPYHASEMYSRNLTTFLGHLSKTGFREPDLQDEIIRDTLVTRGGEVVNERIRPLLGMEPLASGEEAVPAESGDSPPNDSNEEIEPPSEIPSE